MFQPIESASLIINHASISATDGTTGSSNTGYWEAGKVTTVWRINMKTLCGDMWEKHDTFILRLNQLSYAYASSYAATDNVDNLVEFRISGLNFTNSCYDVVRGKQTNQFRALLLKMSNQTATTVSLSPNISMANFKKGADFVELKIELYRVTDGLKCVAGTNPFPHMSYNFDIIPVAETSQQDRC